MPTSNLLPGPEPPSELVLPATRPRTQASPWVGSADGHDLWGPPQPEQAGRPSGAVCSPLVDWDPEMQANGERASSRC